jgi:Immunoglobulin domain
MNKQIPHIKIPHIITLAAIIGFLAIAPNTTHAQTTDSLLADPVDQSEFPQITAQPVDQVVPIGGNVVLSVQAINADGYQWLRNGVPVDGQTNSVLVIQNAGIDDVGLYSCNVFNGAQAVPTRAANVMVYTAGSSVVAANGSSAMAKSSMMTASAGGITPCMTGGGPITVYGTPLLSNGSSGGCPGHYAGYVIYSKPYSQGWGWTPTGTVHTVTDTNRTNTKVQYFGAYGDYGCAQTTVSIPNPTFSPVYEFAIYFTNNVPTNAYPMVLLTGFNP